LQQQLLNQQYQQQQQLQQQKKQQQQNKPKPHRRPENVLLEQRFEGYRRQSQPQVRHHFNYF
jgi:hypothetical protein